MRETVFQFLCVCLQLDSPQCFGYLHFVDLAASKTEGELNMSNFILITPNTIESLLLFVFWTLPAGIYITILRTDSGTTIRGSL